MLCGGRLATPRRVGGVSASPRFRPQQTQRISRTRKGQEWGAVAAGLSTVGSLALWGQGGGLETRMLAGPEAAPS